MKKDDAGNGIPWNALDAEDHLKKLKKRHRGQRPITRVDTDA